MWLATGRTRRPGRAAHRLGSDQPHLHSRRDLPAKGEMDRVSMPKIRSDCRLLQVWKVRSRGKQVRLPQPLVRENGTLRPASWDEALDRAAAGFAVARDR